MKTKIAIVVGHDSKDPGARAVAPINQNEYEFNTELAKILCIQLDTSFSPTVYFRDGLGINRTYDELEKIKPDFNIELHFNSHTDKSVRGTETLCSVNSYNFARVVQRNLCDTLKRKDKEDRGVRLITNPNERGWHSVSRLSCPNVLIEPWFGSNSRDAQLMSDSKERLCIALELSIHEYLVSLLSMGKRKS